MPETTIEQQLQKTIEGLQQQLQEQKAVNEALEAVNADLTAKVEELSKPAATQQPVAEKPLEVPKDSFEVGRKKYVFIAPVFQHEGKRIVASDALADKALLETLVKRGSGVIKAV